MCEDPLHEVRLSGQEFRGHLKRGSKGCQTVRSACRMPRTSMTKSAEQAGATPLQLRRILLPTDFSGCANYALPYAAAIARAVDATIICVNVVEPIVPAVGYTGLAEAMPITDGLTASPSAWIARMERAKARTRSRLGTELTSTVLIGPL